VTNILYDFKRSFLRVSVLSFLALFVIAGVFFTYGFLYTIPQAEFNNVNVVVVIENTTSGFHLLGLVFDNQGNAISNAKVDVIYPNSSKTLYTNASGYFSLYGKAPQKITVNYNGQEKSLSLNSTYLPIHIIASNALYLKALQNSYANVSRTYNYFVEGYALIIGYNGHIAKAITFMPNMTFYFYKKSPEEFGYPIPKEGLIGNLTVSQPLTITTITVPKDTVVIYAVRHYADGEFQAGAGNFETVPPIEIDFLYDVGIGTSYLFSFTFGIIFIYIAYQTFGKLKDRGLQLLLARPITRGELYFTRYFSGVLSMLTAALLFSLATSIIFVIYIGIFPTYDMTILFSLVFLNVIAWYSLSFLLLSKLSPSAGLGLSVGIYIVLNLLLILPILPGKLTYYFYPTSFALSVLYYSVNFSYPINPVISALVETAWVIIPVLVGYLIFKRIDV